MTLKDLKISQFAYKQAHLLAKLRRDIDAEADHVLAKKGERKENALHVIAKLLISQRRVITFIAFDGNKDIGYVSLVFPKFTKLRGNAYLTIAVRGSYHGKGVGSALMEHAEHYAKECGVRRMELEVFGKNKNAFELYKKRNYLVEGVKKDAISDESGFDDIIIMSKKLA